MQEKKELYYPTHRRIAKPIGIILRDPDATGDKCFAIIDRKRRSGGDAKRDGDYLTGLPYSSKVSDGRSTLSVQYTHVLDGSNCTLLNNPCSDSKTLKSARVRMSSLTSYKILTPLSNSTSRI